MAILPHLPQKVIPPVDDGSPAPYGTTHPVTHQVAEAIANALATSGLTLTLGGHPVPLARLGHARQHLPLLLWAIARPRWGGEPIRPDGLRLAFVPHQAVTPEGERRSYVTVRVLNPQVSEVQLSRWTQALLDMLRVDESLQREAEQRREKSEQGQGEQGQADEEQGASMEPDGVSLEAYQATFMRDLILPVFTRHDMHHARAEELLGLALGATVNEPERDNPPSEEKGQQQSVEDLRKTAEYPRWDMSALPDGSPAAVIDMIQKIIDDLDKPSEGKIRHAVDEPSGATQDLTVPFPLLTSPDATLAALRDNQHRTQALTDALGEVYVPITVAPGTYADATVMTTVIDGWSLRLKALVKRPPYDTFLMADRLFARMSMGVDDKGARRLGGRSLKAVLVQMDEDGVLAQMPVRWRVALVQGLMHPAARDEEVIEALRRDIDLDDAKDAALMLATEVPGTPPSQGVQTKTPYTPAPGWEIPAEVAGNDRNDLLMVFQVLDVVEIYGATQEALTQAMTPLIEEAKNWDDVRWTRLIDALAQGLVARCPDLTTDVTPRTRLLGIDIRKIIIQVIREVDRDLPESRRDASIQGLIHPTVRESLIKPLPFDWTTLPQTSLLNRQTSKDTVTMFLELCNSPPVTEDHQRVLADSVQNAQSLDLLRRLVLNHWPHAQQVSTNRLLVQLVRGVAHPLDQVLLGMDDPQGQDRLPVPAWFRSPAWAATGPMAEDAPSIDHPAIPGIDDDDGETPDVIKVKVSRNTRSSAKVRVEEPGDEPEIEVEKQRFKPCRGSVGEFPNSALFKVLVDNTPLRTVGMDPWDWQDAMDRTFPWMGEVTARITRRLSIQLAHNLPLLLPTLGLLGGSGVGKTLYWTEAMRLLDHPFIVQSMGGQNDSVAIKGTSAGWSNARPGLAATVMASLTCGNPVIMLDEIDKTAGNDRNGRSMDALLPLLETATAQVYRDDCLQLTVDTSNISWLMTLNDEEGLSPELRSRVDVVEVKGPDWTNPVHVEAALLMGEALAWQAWPTRLATEETRLSDAQKNRLRSTQWKSLRSLSQGIRAMIEDNLYQASLDKSLGRRSKRPTGLRPPTVRDEPSTVQVTVASPDEPGAPR